MSELAADLLSEIRRCKNVRHLLMELFRQSRGPVMRAIVDRKGLERSAAASSQRGRFETAWLTTDDNLAALAQLSGAWIDRARQRRRSKTIVLDIDSRVSPTHGEQKGSFNHFGDLRRCALRRGHVHSADGCRELLEPMVGEYRDRKRRRDFRADAAFALPEVC